MEPHSKLVEEEVKTIDIEVGEEPLVAIKNEIT